MNVFIKAIYQAKFKKIKHADANTSISRSCRFGIVFCKLIGRYVYK